MGEQSMKFPKIKNRMNVWSYLVLGYFLVVMTGSVLLVLPFASREGGTSYIDALFTATSAACVTGLVPFETNIHWSLFGQIVILLLIQLGGLGFMTFVSVLLLMVKRGLGQYERRAVLQSVGGSRLTGINTLVRRILVGTFIFEFLGAAALSIRFIPDFGVGQGIYYAVFHAVSAFCNAGFDLMGGTVAGTGSLTYYVRDPLVTLTLCVLIIVGGFGFCVWGDIADCRGNLKKTHFYTKVILIVNFSLVVGGTLLFLLFERNNPSYADFNFGEKLLASLFNSTTARTAGFYTTDPITLSDSGYMLMLVLMFIGGCSGSTAGGIKVGTITVIITGMVSAFRGSRDINLGKRRIDAKLLFQALAIFAAYLFMVLVSTMIICAVEPDHSNSMAMALFECVSALGTVGLSMGYTATLGVASKIILVVLMFAGRVGILTLAFALSKRKPSADIRRPVETFYIG